MVNTKKSQNLVKFHPQSGTDAYGNPCHFSYFLNKPKGANYVFGGLPTYLDSLDKVHKTFLQHSETDLQKVYNSLKVSENFDKKLTYERSKKTNPNKFLCLQGYVHGACDNGHRFAKAIICDKEYCPECGEKDSPVHQRRIARWLDKAFDFDNLGYMVITIPREYRHLFLNKIKTDLRGNYIQYRLGDKIPDGYTFNKRSKLIYTTSGTQNLRDFKKYIKRKFHEELGYERGFLRWHWAGDCKQCKGDGCQICKFTGANKEWNPHLNLLIDETMLSKKQLEKIRTDIGRWLFNKKGINYNLKSREKDYVINYNYTRKHYTDKQGNQHDNTGKFFHKVRYITRATWRYNDRDLTSDSVIHTIKGHRTGSTWGKWDKIGTSENELNLLERCMCPVCVQETGEITKIKFEKFMPKTEFFYFFSHEVREIDGGYYQIFENEYLDHQPPDTPPPDTPPKYGLIGNFEPVTDNSDLNIYI